MATTEKIKLTDEKETLFIPLSGKALDFRSKKSVLKDKKANDIVEQVGLDLTAQQKFTERIGSLTLAVRARQYDEWAKEFLAKNPNAVVLHLGCGLDARIVRAQPPTSTLWFDVDYPEVIDLRRQFYSETAEYKMVASSITAQNWLETIPSGKPALIVAEGVFEYLSEEEVKALLCRLTNHFPNGQIAFDVMNHYAQISGNKNLKKTTGAVNILKCAFDSIDEVDKLNPKLKRLNAVSRIKSVYTKELPLAFRLVLGIVGLSSKLKNGMRLLRYEF